jgi:hypothetical protein
MNANSRETLRCSSVSNLATRKAFSPEFDNGTRIMAYGPLMNAILRLRRVRKRRAVATPMNASDIVQEFELAKPAVLHCTS